MGCCVSTSSWNSRSIEERVSPSFWGIAPCGRKRTRGPFSGHVPKVKHLPSIPNRIITNGMSQTSCLFTQQGGKGVNQDAAIVWEDFMSEDVTFCGLYDGHGPDGHLVSSKVRDSLPLKLFSYLISSNSKNNGSAAAAAAATTAYFNWNLKSKGQDSKEDHSIEDKVDSLWTEAFLKSYKAMDKELRSHRKLDSFYSGSSAVTLVKQGSNLFMGSIGDSRAILATQDNSGSMVAVQLTVDLKPDLPSEAERIKRFKGRIFSLEDEPGVLRVWVPNEDAPGIAMARAFGDFCLKKYGVISTPEFSHRILMERDRFIVLASDGIWDMFSNDEVIKIVSSAPTRSSAARVLVDSAGQKWKSKYPTSKIDDCTVICLYLDGKMDSESDCQEQVFSSATLHSNHLNKAGELDGGKNSESSLQEQKWLDLEGVSRVNSLVKIPRFSEEEMKT
ncbi:hypothetical protein LguiB_002398 [Lonicera macranthoides]